MILIVEITVLTGISFLLILTEPIGALSLIIFFTMLSYLFQNFTKKRLAIWGKKRLGFEVEMLKNIVNGLDGIKDVKVFNKSLNFLELFFAPLYYSKLLDQYLLNYSSLCQLDTMRLCTYNS